MKRDEGTEAQGRLDWGLHGPEHRTFSSDMAASHCRSCSTFLRRQNLPLPSETHTLAALFMQTVMVKCGQIGTPRPRSFRMDGDAPQ